MAIPKVEFAPLNIPLNRRLQTFAVCCFVATFLHPLGFLTVGLLVALLFTNYYWLVLLYAAFYCYDYQSFQRGGYNLQFTRKFRLWKYFRDYFPINLIKTVDLDPSKNYIFCCHPHGIMCCGLLTCFATDACDFSSKFPGLIPHFLALKVNFFLPFSREHIMSYGACESSKRCIDYVLSNQGQWKQKGQTCVLVVGGVEEALDTEPNNYILTIKNRKGFIRAALRNGASVVPIFSFGENDVYSTIRFEKGTSMRGIQEKIKEITTYGFPIICGRGIFNYTFGLLPRRKPINVVVGEPIDVPKVANPSDELVDELHNKYIGNLIKLFEEHKHKFVDDKGISLILN